MANFLRNTLKDVLGAKGDEKDDSMPKIKRGFASMSPEKRSELSAKGGKASHGGGRRANTAKKEEEEVQKPATRKSKRGFASMDTEKRKKIAALGGKSSKGGGRPARVPKQSAEEKEKSKLMLTLGMHSTKRK